MFQQLHLNESSVYWFCPVYLYLTLSYLVWQVYKSSRARRARIGLSMRNISLMMINSKIEKEYDRSTQKAARKPNILYQRGADGEM
jgi:hypothetical protein